MLAVQKNKKVFTAVASGFARMMRFQTDVQFALSDHDRLQPGPGDASQSSPKIIYTYGSSAATMAKNLKAHGYNASPAIDVRSDMAEQKSSILKERVD